MRKCGNSLILILVRVITLQTLWQTGVTGLTQVTGLLIVVVKTFHTLNIRTQVTRAYILADSHPISIEMLLLVLGQWFDNLWVWVDSVRLSDLLHLALHHFILISICHIALIIVGDGAICVLGSELLLRLVVSKSDLLGLFTLIRVDLRFISFSGVIVANRCFQWVVVLGDNVLIVLIVASGRCHIRFLMSMWISDSLVWHIVLWHDMLLRGLFLWDLVLLVSKWFGVSVVSWEGSLLTLLLNRSLRVLHLLKLLLVFWEHTFEVVARHRARAWITVA